MGELPYLNKHVQCKNHLTGNACIFCQYTLNKEEYINIHLPKQYLFIFNLSDKLLFDFKDGGEIYLQELHMCSIGFNKPIKINAEDKSTFILMSFDRPQILCEQFDLMNLKAYITEENRACRSLPIIPCVQNFLKTIQFYLKHELLCKNLHEIKQSEWIILMLNFYSYQENALFFYPLIENYNSFEALIYENAPKVTTVRELADVCNMSAKTFTRKFKTVFGTTPKQWMLKQKKQKVLIEVTRTKNTKELPEKLGFSSYAHLNSYCMKQFDASVKELQNDR